MTKKTNQTPNLNKRKISTTDIILMLLGVFILIRTPWSNMNSFFYLLFFLYIFCIMMRITNLRKQYAKKEEVQRNQAEAEEEIKALESKSDVDTDDVKKASSEQENISSDENPPK